MGTQGPRLTSPHHTQESFLLSYSLTRLLEWAEMQRSIPSPFRASVASLQARGYDCRGQVWHRTPACASPE